MIDSENVSGLPGLASDVRPEGETLPAVESVTESVSETPARRPRRSRKAAPAASAEPVAGEESQVEPAKPRRTSRSRTRAARSAETAPSVTEESSEVSAEEKPKRPRRTRRTGTAASPAPVEGNEAVSGSVPDVSAEAVAASAGQSSGQTGEAGPVSALKAEQAESAAPSGGADDGVAVAFSGEDIPAITEGRTEAPALTQPVTPAVAVPAAVPAVLEKEPESRGSEEPAPDGDAEVSSVQEGTASRRRRSRRSRRRPALDDGELAALTEDSPTPDYVSDDDDEDNDSPESSVTPAELAAEASVSEKRSRRSRRGRRRSGPETVIEKQDSEPEELAEEQTFMLPTDVLEELMADVLESAPSAPQTEPGEAGEALEEGESDADAEEGAARRSRSRRTRGKKKAPEAGESAGESESAEEGKKVATNTPRKMLISVLPGDQVEVVLTEDGQVREYYVEMAHQVKIRGNIYKGVINNIDTNLQAAFVNYGNVKNGFLQIDEVHPEYYLQPHEPAKGRKYPPIQKVLKTGQEVLVQVVKEPNGSKGAFLTTWISLAGRFLVLTPGQEQIGISRKVEDPEERNRLRELIKGLEPGEGLGAIVRTVSAGTSKTTLQKDLNFLKRVWKDIRKRATTEKAPSLIYQEPGLASRSVRDYLSDDVTEVWVDDESTATSIREMATLLFPRKADLVHLYTDHKKTLWEHFNVLSQIEQVHAREVTMPSGGRLVFDQTEALMAIDINSGKIGGKTNFEAMAYRTNMEAARVIAQQLRLRDIGGQVVIDFIEMRDPEHCRDVEKEIRNAMKGDRARHDIGKMSSFGLLQIVRQRTGSSAISISMETCPHCNGTGQRRTMEWQAIQAQRELHRGLRSAAASGQASFLYTVEPELGLYLLNHKREQLSALEQEFHARIEIRIDGISPALLPVPEKNGGKQS